MVATAKEINGFCATSSSSAAPPPPRATPQAIQAAITTWVRSQDIAFSDYSPAYRTKHDLALERIAIERKTAKQSESAAEGGGTMPLTIYVPSTILEWQKWFRKLALKFHDLEEWYVEVERIRKEWLFAFKDQSKEGVEEEEEEENVKETSAEEEAIQSRLAAQEEKKPPPSKLLALLEEETKYISGSAMLPLPLVTSVENERAASFHCKHHGGEIPLGPSTHGETCALGRLARAGKERAFGRHEAACRVQRGQGQCRCEADQKIQQNGSAKIHEIDATSEHR
ncbi:unnamed protein product [Rotaria magnacalcarata]|uniref:Uncharacterized protein n=1 Tax=Rotaria magnacalcarata TaxID=392030 RepID=A0A8S2IH53_9BILA|nr:unnamed protein product [Rotaria magnacalcarata]